MHKKLIFYIISRIFLVVSFFLFLPLAWAAHDDLYSVETNAFVVAILVGFLLVAVGRSLFFVKKINLQAMNTKDALGAVGMVWIFLSIWGALPLWLSDVVPSFTDAVFEVVSGFTTTGSSIFSNVEILPRGILFWRSLTHWIGGMGIVVLYVALLPAFGGSTYQLYKAEASGISTDRVVPRLKENAKILWIIYVFLSSVCFLFLFFGGMSVFDALCHTFGSIATGGFSTKNASLGAYSPYLQWVIAVAMFLGGINFLLYYWLFLGKPLSLFRDEEFKAYAGWVLFFSATFVFVLWRSNLSAAPVRDAVFQVISIVTTTGFFTADFDLLPDILRGLLLFFMSVGACAGSTSGGLKIVRLVLTAKIGIQSVTKAIFPNAVVPVRFNRATVSEKVALSILTYFSLCVFLILLGTLLLIIFDSTDILTAVSSAVSAISSVGPGLAKTGPVLNYGWMSVPSKWVLIFLMIAGRLELYAVLILFSPATWKK